MIFFQVTHRIGSGKSVPMGLKKQKTTYVKERM
jgi:hypothetical protein